MAAIFRRKAGSATGRLPRKGGSRRNGAFTLVELLMVIAVVGILASLLLPALAKAKQKAQRTQCLSQLRQLQQAWLMYVHDHHDSLPPNSDGPRAGKDAYCPGWVAGWLRGNNYDGTNTDLLVGSKYVLFGSIGGYVQNPKIYRCPSDRSQVTLDGIAYDRTRSVAMNAYMNGLGQWQSRDFVTFRKLGQIPSATDYWVFMDERAESLNDGYFATDMEAAYRIVDYPGSYHDQGTGVTFSDGHVEYHRWVEPTTLPKLGPGEEPRPTVTKSYDRDLAWLTARTTLRR